MMTRHTAGQQLAVALSRDRISPGIATYNTTRPVYMLAANISPTLDLPRATWRSSESPRDGSIGHEPVNEHIVGEKQEEEEEEEEPSTMV